MSKNESKSIVAWVLLGIVGALLLLSIIINLALAAGIAASATSKAVARRGEDEFPNLNERWSYGSGTVKVARITVQGPIFRETDGGPFRLRVDRVAAILREIRAATVDQEVKGIVLEINSPGGDLTSSDEIHAALQAFRAHQPGRRIVSFAAGTAASGGYYIALPGDHIVVEPTAIVGSIGVIMQTLNWKVLAEKIGVTDTTVKSGQNKDLLNPFRDVPPEQLELLQSLIDSFHTRFCELVCESRKMSMEELKPLADGRIFTAKDALQNRLADSIGYWEDAVARIAELLNTPSVKVIRYEYRPSFSEILANLAAPIPDIRSLAAEPPRLQYLWQP